MDALPGFAVISDLRNESHPSCLVTVLVLNASEARIERDDSRDASRYILDD